MIIAFGHQKGVGKDYAARYLLTKCQTSCAVLSFAKPLYDCCSDLYSDFKGKMFYDSQPELKGMPLDCGKTPREILLYISKSLTDFDDEIFVRRIESMLYNYNTIFITDVRRKVEVRMLQRHNAKLIKIVNPQRPESDSDIDAELDTFTDWDKVIVNDFTSKFEKRLNKEVTPWLIS